MTWRRVLLTLAMLATIWAIAVASTGGFSIRVLGIRISSQSPVNVAMVALAAALAALSAHDRRVGNRWAAWINPATVIAMLGIALVIHQWGVARPLWLDEEMIALNLRDRTLADLPGQLWLQQTAPLGWLMLQRLVLVTLGTGELSVRLLPALFGIATITCAFWIGQRWMTLIGATTLVLLCSFGQWLSFYSVELKHYSADTFWALALPGLAVWATDVESEEAQTKRLAGWWLAAAAGHWLSVGALLVIPACVAGLLFVLVRAGRVQAAKRTLLYAGLWLLSFVPHYLLSIRHARESEYFRDFWAFAFPPTGSGLSTTASWFADQLEPFALKPGGTGLWLLFWLAAIVGFGLHRRSALGLFGALVMMSAFVMTGLRLVPLYERVSLWFLVTIYLGIALFADSIVTVTRRFAAGRQPLDLAVTLVMAVAAFQLCSDIAQREFNDLRLARPNDSNRYVDDRSAVAWLMRQREPGDVVMTTHFGLPAVWWYGKVRISDGRLPGSEFNKVAILRIEHATSPSDCQPSNLGHVLRDYSRALIYLGFEDYQKGFDDLVLAQVGEVGSVTALQHFGSISRVAVVNLRARGNSELSDRYQWKDMRAPQETPLSGCVTARVAERW